MRFLSGTDNDKTNLARLVIAMAGSVGVRLAGMLFAFLIGVQLARGLGPEGYGAYGIAMAVIAVLMIPTELGLPQLLVREVSSSFAREQEGAARLSVRWAINIVAKSSVAIASVMGLLLITGAINVDHAVRYTLYVGLLCIPVVALGNIYGAALRGMGQVVVGQMGEVLLRPLLVSSMLFVAFTLAGGDIRPYHAMGINVAGALFAAVFSAAMLRRVLSNKSFNTVPPGLKITDAVPMAMSEGMRILAGHVGMFILGAYSPTADAALFRVASAVYAMTTMPTALVNSVCSPKIAALYSERKFNELVKLIIPIFNSLKPIT